MNRGFVVKEALCAHYRHWNGMPGVSCGEPNADAYNGDKQPISLHMVSPNTSLSSSVA
jgi:hypothetical protein